jgi:hypothetical protein
MKAAYFSILLLYISSCTDKVNTLDMIEKVNPTVTQFEADGQSIVYLSAILNNDLDQRSVLFKVNSGSFPDNSGADSIIVTAEKLSGQLTAVAKYMVPASPGDIDVKVQMQIPDYKNLYVYEFHMTATSSVVVKLKLTADAFSVYNNFDGEIHITGKLTNAEGNGVSQGVIVELHDLDSSYLPIHGSFRDAKFSSNGSSQITATYSPGFVAANQVIYIVGTVMNQGVPTMIADTLSIAINQEH